MPALREISKGCLLNQKKFVRGGIQSIFHLTQTITLLENLNALLLNQRGSQLIQIDNRQWKKMKICSTQKKKTMKLPNNNYQKTDSLNFSLIFIW